VRGSVRQSGGVGNLDVRVFADRRRALATLLLPDSQRVLDLDDPNEPGDFDACWDTDGVDLDALDPVLLDLSAGRSAQKSRYGGELFPNVVETLSGLVFDEFFQNERDTGRKGIVVLAIGGQQ